MENILEVRDLTKNLSGFRLDKLSFSLPRGYVMGFIGPNGAGKTTTIKLMMNLMKKDGGKVRLFGRDHGESRLRDKIGFVYEENYFYEYVTVGEMKKIIAPFYSRWDEEAFQKYARRFNLPQKKKIRELSRGMKTKFSLALALSHRAELVIMDEPTSGLDPVFRSELLDILAELLQDERTSILFSTHITTDLEKIADYICFINRGKLVFCQTKEEVLKNYVVVKGSTGLLNPDTRKLFVGVREHAFGFEGLSSRVSEVRQRLDDQVLLEKAGLEDIMLFTVRGEKNAQSD